jgi:hypothetical protein
MAHDDPLTEPMTIENRADFAQWAIERSPAIVADQGGNLALAARDMSDEKIAETANALGQVIVDALLEVFDGLVSEAYACRLHASRSRGRSKNLSADRFFVIPPA